MRVRAYAATLAVSVLLSVVAAQEPAAQEPAANAPALSARQRAPQTAPVAEAFRNNARDMARHLIAAGEEMPAEKYGYKPTPEQMSFAAVVDHLVIGIDYLCSTIGGSKPPARTNVAATESTGALVGRLRETFRLCDDALVAVADSRLAEHLPFFDGHTRSRTAVMTLATGEGADHYSQAAIYLRLNGRLPPTGKRPS